MSGYIKIVYHDPNNQGDESEIEHDILLKAEDLENGILSADDQDEQQMEEEETGQTDQIPSTSSGSSKQKSLACNWTTKESNFLLKRYNKYITKIGHNQLFTTKKDMWHQISKEMKTSLNFSKSAFQCENRYKTLLRRWKRTTGYSSAVKNGETTNNETVTTAVSTAAEHDYTSASSESKESEAIIQTMWKIFQMKEEAKERRHKEKMDLLRKLVNKKLY